MRRWMLWGCVTGSLCTAYYWIIDIFYIYVDTGKMPDERGAALISSTLDWPWFNHPQSYIEVNQVVHVAADVFGFGLFFIPCLLIMLLLPSGK